MAAAAEQYADFLVVTSDNPRSEDPDAIIDDVIATGDSLNALEKLAELAGASVVARAAVLAELDSVYRDDIIYLKEHYVFTPNPDGTFTPIECEEKKRRREAGEN